MKRSRRLRYSLLLFALLLETAASADIYRWTDGEGREHFTQRLDQVPAEHRYSAKQSAAKERASRPAKRESAAIHARRSRGSVRALEIPFERLGSVMKVDVRVNDRVVAPFLIDTGASGVSLPSHVAEQLGIRVGPKTPTLEIHTANGVVARPVVMLDSIELGGARVEKLNATVNPTMDIGLLGGTFFNNFVYQVDAAESVIRLQRNDSLRGGLSAEDWSSRYSQLRAPLTRLDAYLASDAKIRAAERERLRSHRSSLERALEELDEEANRLGVPQSWRKP